jgi:hypothetical protein
MRSDIEVDFLVRELFGDDDGRAVARRIDERIDRLPGLAGLHLVDRAVDRCAPAPAPSPSPPKRWTWRSTEASGARDGGWGGMAPAA